MKRLSTGSAAATTTNHHHHYHSHHNSISSTATTFSLSKERLFPLHRSVTDDNSYNNKLNSSSPITKFVCKLLGLAGPSTARPRLWHKSRSTTSITKSSVISASAIPTTTTSSTSPSTNTTVRKPTAITFVTPNSPCTLSSSVMDWDRGSLPNSTLYLNEIDEEQQQQRRRREDDVISISSNDSVSTINSSISSSIVVINNSAAVDALVSASLIPTKTTNKKSIKTTNNGFDDMPFVTLENRKPGSEVVMTEKIAEMIRPYIPRRYRVAQKWNLLYSLDQHGVSLATLYSLMKNYDGPCIMIIKDADEQIFGSYLSNSLSSQSRYYGTGECFLWKLSSLHPKEDSSVPKIKTYPWTGKNDYMILSDSDFIAIGGGNGKFGLWLNSDLEKGYTNTCPTFDNESLSLKPEFECMEMEIWGFSI